MPQTGLLYTFPKWDENFRFELNIKPRKLVSQQEFSSILPNTGDIEEDVDIIQKSMHLVLSPLLQILFESSQCDTELQRIYISIFSWFILCFCLIQITMYHLQSANLSYSNWTSYIAHKKQEEHQTKIRTLRNTRTFRGLGWFMVTKAFRRVNIRHLDRLIPSKYVKRASHFLTPLNVDYQKRRCYIF